MKMYHILIMESDVINSIKRVISGPFFDHEIRGDIEYMLSRAIDDAVKLGQIPNLNDIRETYGVYDVNKVVDVSRTIKVYIHIDRMY